MNPIKKIRKANDLTRNELSLLLNLPYSTLTEVENTNYNNPKNVIEKLADVFDVDEDLLIRDYNECREEKRKELMNKIKWKKRGDKNVGKIRQKKWVHLLREGRLFSY